MDYAFPEAMLGHDSAVIDTGRLSPVVGPLAQPSVIHSWPGQQGTAEPQNPGDGSYVEEEKNWKLAVERPMHQDLQADGKWCWVAC